MVIIYNLIFIIFRILSAKYSNSDNLMIFEENVTIISQLLFKLLYIASEIFNSNT